MHQLRRRDKNRAYLFRAKYHIGSLHLVRDPVQRVSAHLCAARVCKLQVENFFSAARKSPLTACRGSFPGQISFLAAIVGIVRMEDATGSAAPPRAAPVDATKRPHFVARPATRIPPEGADGSNLDAFTSIDVDLMNQLFAGENYQKILCQSVLWKGKTLDINPIMRKTDGDTNGVECVWIAVPLSSEHAAKWTAKEVLDIFELCFDRLRYVRVVLVIEVFSPENQDPPASARVSSNPEGSSRARPSAASLAVIRDNIPENASSPPQGHNRPPMSAKKTPSGVRTRFLVSVPFGSACDVFLARCPAFLASLNMLACEFLIFPRPRPVRRFSSFFFFSDLTRSLS